MAVDPIGIQMKRKELTKTFMMILNWEKPFCLFIGVYMAVGMGHSNGAKTKYMFVSDLLSV